MFVWKKTPKIHSLAPRKTSVPFSEVHFCVPCVLRLSDPGSEMKKDYHQKFGFVKNKTMKVLA